MFSICISNSSGTGMNKSIGSTTGSSMNIRVVHVLAIGQRQKKQDGPPHRHVP